MPLGEWPGEAGLHKMNKFRSFVDLTSPHFLKVWGTLDFEGRKNRGLISLLRRHECNLKPEQVPVLRGPKLVQPSF